MTIAEALAERAVAVRYKDLPAETVHWTKISILDTVASALAGSVEECARIADRVSTGGVGPDSGPALVFGTKRRVPALDAALINGAAAHALDFDASSNVLAGHPTVHILPALVALGEAMGANGESFVAAYVAGFETQSRMARGVQPYQSDKGWFPTANVGIFGTTAACCNLLGLDPGRTANALGIAANFSSGMMVNAGTMTKPVTAGHAARSGMMAALMAKEGMDAALNAIEDKRGFLSLYSGAGNFDEAAILAGWGDPFEIAETAVCLKQHPCCGVLQSSVDVMAALVEAHALTPGKVERIEARLITKRFGHVDRPDPRSGIDAKFSVQYCLARTLVQGRLRIEDFEGTAFRDPAIHEVMKLVDAATHPGTKANASRSEQGGVEITVHTRDGQGWMDRATQPIGRVPGHPLPDRLLDAKFRDCASRVLSSEKIEPLLALVRKVETLSSLQLLTDAMMPD